MKAKQEKSTKQNRADGNRAVTRRSITLSERRVEKLYADVHEAAMKVRIAHFGQTNDEVDWLLFKVQMACCEAAVASVREGI